MLVEQVSVPSGAVTACSDFLWSCSVTVAGAVGGAAGGLW